MKFESIGLAAVLAVLSSTALSHDGDPPVDATPAEAAMRDCQTVGVRAAWGAQARFLGAPAVFRYIAEAPLRRMFMGESAIPTDAIYVMEGLDLRQRREYEESAFFGWKQADRWVQEGRPQPEYTVLASLFYQRCKESLTATSGDEGSADYN